MSTWTLRLRNSTESVEERSRRTREFVIEPGYSYVEPVAPVDRLSSSPGPSSPEPTNDFMFEDEASYGGGGSIGSDIDEDRFRMYEDNERPNYEGGIMEFEPEEEESSTSSSESEEDVEESRLFQQPTAGIEGMFSHNIWSPFCSELEMIIILFFKASKDNFSRRITLMTLALVREVLRASHDQRTQHEKKVLHQHPFINNQERSDLEQKLFEFDPFSTFPSNDKVCKCYKKRRNNFLKVAVKKCTVVKNEKNIDFWMFPITEHLRLVLGNKKKVKILVSLPDRTAGIRTHLNQGEKWKYASKFQSPMIPCIDGSLQDLWIGDVVTIDNTRINFLVDSFFLENGKTQSSVFRLDRFTPSNGPSITYNVINCKLEKITITGQHCHLV
ncbi:hypothetical protein BD770DRAFT_458513 [Pilaira anomala]|nr:hypothetical protein BD770DRAFT_458513 [Pilaira anomala]